MLGDMGSVKKNYSVVQQENGNLIGEYIKRRNNHEELLRCLNSLKDFIRKASNLHYGPIKNKIVASSREAIKNKKMADIIKICLSN